MFQDAPFIKSFGHIFGKRFLAWGKLDICIMGGCHGVMQVIENLFSKQMHQIRKRGIGKIIAWLFVFGFCSIAWVFFRATTISDAFYILQHMFAGLFSSKSNLFAHFGITKIRFITRFGIILFMTTVLAIYDFFNYKEDVIEKITNKHVLFQWMFYVLIGLSIVFFSQKGVATEFVYFQF